MEDQFNSEQEYQNFENPEPQRPFGLSFACVLSFINAGFQCIGNAFTYLLYNTMHELAQSEEYQDLMEKYMPDAEQTETVLQSQLAVSRVSYLLMALLFAASFYGVLQMWRLQKKGFHIYAIAQILMLIVTAVFVTSVTGDSMNGPIVLTVLWIGLYYIYYRKKLQ